jgi:hypothetical protein
MNGFKVISERMTQERMEFKNKTEINNNTTNQDISIGKTAYIKSSYVVTMNYTGRLEIGCGGQTISSLSGQIVDLNNNGKIVATFSFNQSSFEGKCTTDVMNMIAEIIKNKARRTTN